MMKKAFYFFLLLTVAVACRKVDEPSFESTVKCWPLSIVKYTVSGVRDTVSNLFFYDKQNRLINYQQNSDLFIFEVDTVKNIITKRNHYLSTGALVDYQVYQYDSYGRLFKSLIYEPYNVSKAGIVAQSTMLKSLREGITPLASTKVDGETVFALSEWVEFQFSGDIKYPSGSVRYHVPNKVVNRDSAVVNYKNIEALYHFKAGKIVERYEFTYDNMKNAYSGLGFNPYVVNDSLYTANNVLSYKRIVKDVSGNDSVALDCQNTIKYSVYNYPVLISNKRDSIVFTYKVDSVALVNR
jgi:hypothetical protein